MTVIFLSISSFFIKYSLKSNIIISPNINTTITGKNTICLVLVPENEKKVLLKEVGNFVISTDDRIIIQTMSVYYRYKNCKKMYIKFGVGIMGIAWNQ